MFPSLLHKTRTFCQSDMEQLEAQCQSAKEYPLNITESTALTQNQESRWTRLNDQESRLFCAESKASLEFLEYGQQQMGRFKSQDLIRPN